MEKCKRSPRANREAVSAGAVLHAGNHKFSCSIINIATSGVLVFAPEKLAQGTFIRVNLTLPEVYRVLDVDGVVARVGTREGHIILGIKFYEPSQDFTATLSNVVDWLERKREKRGARKRPSQAAPRKPVPAKPAAKPRVASPPAAAHPARKVQPPPPVKRKLTLDDLARMRSELDADRDRREGRIPA